MKSIVKILVTVIALGVMASAPVLRAQDATTPSAEGKKGKGGQMTTEQRVEQLDKAVTLTAKQKTEVTEIYTKAAEETRALPQDERRTKSPEIMKTARAKVRALLNEKQQAAFDAMPAPAAGKGKKKQG